MVASPEVSRQNGKKSSGPVTERGKAIASQNATKHGMLSQQPHLLATEDLETFQGIMQGLIDQYQPQNPTEHLLVQQVAMGWLRLHRLWGVEAAIANKEVLQVQRRALYPDRANSSSNSAFTDSFLAKTKPYSEVLKGEQTALQGLITDLEHDLSNLPNNPGDHDEWFEVVQESLGNARRACPEEVKEVKVDPIWSLLEDFLYSLEWDEDTEDSAPTIDKAIEEAKCLIKTAPKRIKGIEKILTEISHYDQAIQQAEAASKGLQAPEVFSRYERHITRQLNEAIDRLARIKEQRNQADSMGSFGQTDLQGTLAKIT